MATLKVVNGFSTAPDGTFRSGRVRAVLSTGATITSNQEVVPTTVSTQIKPDGTWTLSVYSNSDLSPAQTYYTFTEVYDDGTSFAYTVIVPGTAGPFNVAAIMSGVPGQSVFGGHVSTLLVDGAATFTAGPVVIGTDPGGSQLLRVGGSSTFSGIATFTNDVRVNGSSILRLGPANSAVADSAGRLQLYASSGFIDAGWGTSLQFWDNSGVSQITLSPSGTRLLSKAPIQFDGTLGSLILEATGNNLDLTRPGTNYITATAVGGGLNLGAGGRLNDVQINASTGDVTLAGVMRVAAAGDVFMPDGHHIFFAGANGTQSYNIGLQGAEPTRVLEVNARMAGATMQFRTYDGTFSFRGGASEVDLATISASTASPAFTIGPNASGGQAAVQIGGLGSSSAALIFTTANVNQWQIYRPGGADAHLYFRDLVNARMHMIFTPGATLSSAGTEFASTVQVDSSLTVYATGAVDPVFYINGAAGQNRITYLQTAGVNRWAFYAGNGAETGSNVGSDFVISRYTDAGGYNGTPLSISRPSGVVTLGNGLVISTGGASITGANGVTSVVPATSSGPALLLTTNDAVPWSMILRRADLGTTKDIQFFNSAGDLAVYFNSVNRFNVGAAGGMTLISANVPNPVLFSTPVNQTGVGATTVALRGNVGGYGAGITMQSSDTGTSTVLPQAAIEAEGETSWATVALANSFMRFSTAQAGVLSEKVRIAANGTIQLFATSPGIDMISAGNLIIGGTQANGITLGHANINVDHPGADRFTWNSTDAAGNAQIRMRSGNGATDSASVSWFKAGVVEWVWRIVPGVGSTALALQQNGAAPDVINIQPSGLMTLSAAGDGLHLTGNVTLSNVVLGLWDNGATEIGRMIFAGANTAGARYFGVLQQNTMADYMAIGTTVAKDLVFWTGGSNERVRITSAGVMNLADGLNITTGGTTGTQIATAATQKLGFFGKTPVVQPSGTPTAATDLATVISLANSLRTALLNLGVVA